jgi:Zn finger protein HypA/HybF involved in hydrogenase expression
MKHAKKEPESKPKWRFPIDKLARDGATVECLNCTHAFRTTEEVCTTQDVFCPKCGKTNTRQITHW